MQNCSSVDGPVISRSRPTLAISRDNPALCASPQPKSSEYLVNLFFLSILFPAPGGPRKPAPPAKRENTPASPPFCILSSATRILGSTTASSNGRLLSMVNFWRTGDGPTEEYSSRSHPGKSQSTRAISTSSPTSASRVPEEQSRNDLSPAACPGMLIFNCFNSFYEYN